MALPSASVSSTPDDSTSHKRLGDFTADTRLLIITPMAAVVGVISSLVAVALVWLIGAAAWREIAEEEQVREAGWLSGRARLLRMKVPRVISEGDDPEQLAS